jgi:DNA-binding LytR/AlgR family response regulator
MIYFNTRRFIMEIHSASYRVSHISPIGSIGSRVKLAGIPAFDPASVIYLEGSGNYTIVHFDNGRKEMVAVTLQLVARQLPALIRVHKSYAIAATGIGNIRWIGEVISKQVLVLTMRNNVRITVARRKEAEIAPVLAQRTGIVIG